MSSKNLARASASLTRPNDTTAYTAGDLIANDTTAGSVTLLTFEMLGSDNSRAHWLRRVKVTKSDPDLTNADIRLWLTSDSAVTFSNGDNGALAIGSSSLAIGSVFAPIDLSFDYTLPGAGDVAIATFDAGIHLLEGQYVYGFLEARAAYTPGAQEVFTVSLNGDAY